MNINGYKIEYGSDLSKAKLSGANLYMADLYKANLSGADLSEADLSRAKLFEADLFGAKLSEANLYMADLSRADLCGANLSRAHLSRANLSEADLSEADLSKADLSEADLPYFQICPQEGSFVAYKKVDTGVIKIEVPAEANRTSSLVGRKCRAEFVKVLEGSGKSGRGGYYIEGKTYYPDSYDDDIRVECTHGVHFFMTRREAENWWL